jgi:hypothetical protein
LAFLVVLVALKQESLMSIQALEPLIAKLVKNQPNQVLTLPKGEYSASGQLILTDLPNLTIKTDPASILHAPGVQSVWEVHTPGFTVDGFTCPTAGVYFHACADKCSLLNATLGFNGVLQQAVLDDVTGTNLLVQDVTVDVTNAQTVYIYGNNATVRRLKVVRGSWGEYVIRVSSVGTPEQRPKGLLIDSCDLSNLPNVNGPGKPVVGIRNGDGEMINSVIHGWFDAGETNDPIPPGTNCNFKLTGNKFDSLTVDHSYVEMRGGTIITDGGGNSFDLSQTKVKTIWAVGAGGKFIPWVVPTPVPAPVATPVKKP